MRSVLAPAPHHEPTSRLSSVTREDSFCAMPINGDEMRGICPVLPQDK